MNIINLCFAGTFQQNHSDKIIQYTVIWFSNYGKEKQFQEQFGRKLWISRYSAVQHHILKYLSMLRYLRHALRARTPSIYISFSPVSIQQAEW